MKIKKRKKRRRKKKKNNKNNKKERTFFLYDTVKKKDKKKSNNNQSNNIKININEDNHNDNNKIINEEKKIIDEDKKIIKKEKKIINEDSKIINEDNNIIEVNEKNNKDNKEFKDELNINKSEAFSINSNNKKKSVNNMTNFVESKFNENQSNILINQENNIFVVHQNPLMIQAEKFSKLTDDIIYFNNDLESLLKIIRKIKFEIKDHFEVIIKQIYQKESHLEIYGSSLCKLDIESSDLDLSIISNNNQSLKDLEAYLLNNNTDNKYSNINAIYTASIPIIKLDLDYQKINESKIANYHNLLLNNDYYKKCIKSNYYNDFNIIKIDISLVE